MDIYQKFNLKNILYKWITIKRNLFNLAQSSVISGTSVKNPESSFKYPETAFGTLALKWEQMSPVASFTILWLQVDSSIPSSFTGIFLKKLIY